MALQTIDLTQAVVSWAALFCFVYSSAISLGFTFVKYIQAWLQHPFLFLILFIPYIWMIDMIVFIHVFLVPVNMNVISFPQGLNSEFDKAQFLRLYLCRRGGLPAPTIWRRL